jgi:hypothetical protein
MEDANKSDWADDSNIPLSEFYDKKPSNLDYTMIPNWLRKFSPGTDGVFFQDDVLLVMRQDKDTSTVLSAVEDDRIYIGILQQYEMSRLSDLARPPDLREVDMSLPGVLEVFMKDIIERIWEVVVPPTLKPQMVNICDDFIRSYCLSRTLADGSGSGSPALSALSSAEVFATRVQKALVIATTLKTCFKMKDNPKFQYILEYPDLEPFNTKATENSIGLMHNRVREWDLEAAAKIEVERLKKLQEEQRYEVESDLAELEAEELKFEMERELAEEKAAADAEIRDQIAAGLIPDPEKEKLANGKAEEPEFEFDEDGNRIQKIVAVKFREEVEEVRTDIIGGGNGNLNSDKPVALGYLKLTDTQLADAAGVLLQAENRHKIMTRRSLRERILFMNIK